MPRMRCAGCRRATDEPIFSAGTSWCEECYTRRRSAVKLESQVSCAIYMGFLSILVFFAFFCCLSGNLFRSR